MLQTVGCYASDPLADLAQEVLLGELVEGHETVTLQHGRRLQPAVRLHSLDELSCHLLAEAGLEPTRDGIEQLADGR
jgi:hypothetical protein